VTTAFGGRDVSVVIPVLDHAALLGEAIDSVLGQSEPPAEVIVVDDGSTDGSGDVAARYGTPVRVIRQERRGVAVARNAGCEVASGRLLAFLDADDRWMTDKLEIQLTAMTDDVDIVSGLTAQVPQRNWAQVVREGPPADTWRTGAVPGTVLMRRVLFDRVGQFDPALRAGESLDWHARAVEAGARIVVVPQVVLLRRVHQNSHGTRQREVYVDYLTVARMALARRRTRASKP
jgi:glycosyltransferase involved in cell wall biosynthesis